MIDMFSKAKYTINVSLDRSCLCHNGLLFSNQIRSIFCCLIHWLKKWSSYMKSTLLAISGAITCSKWIPYETKILICLLSLYAMIWNTKQTDEKKISLKVTTQNILIFVKSMAVNLTIQIWSNTKLDLPFCLPKPSFNE